MLARAASVLALLVTLASGCPDKESDTSGGSQTTGGTTEQGSTGATDGATSSGSTGAATPVVCDAVTCEAGELCVVPGIDCDYSKMPPEWTSDPKFCAAVPDGCAADDAACLAGKLCTVSDPAHVEMGTLHCPPKALDCF